MSSCYVEKKFPHLPGIFLNWTQIDNARNLFRIKNKSKSASDFLNIYNPIYDLRFVLSPQTNKHFLGKGTSWRFEINDQCYVLENRSVSPKCRGEVEIYVTWQFYVQSWKSSLNLQNLSFCKKEIFDARHIILRCLQKARIRNYFLEKSRQEWNYLVWNQFIFLNHKISPPD